MTTIDSIKAGVAKLEAELGGAVSRALTFNTMTAAGIIGKVVQGVDLVESDISYLFGLVKQDVPELLAAGEAAIAVLTPLGSLAQPFITAITAAEALLQAAYTAVTSSAPTTANTGAAQAAFSSPNGVVIGVNALNARNRYAAAVTSAHLWMEEQAQKKLGV